MAKKRSGLREPSYFIRKEEKARQAIEPVVFTPVVRDPLKPQTKIKMLTSVHGRFQPVRGQPQQRYDLVAGKSYWVDQEKADEFIVKGYAEGILSRAYSDDEVAAIRATIQVIGASVGGITHG